MAWFPAWWGLSSNRSENLQLSNTRESDNVKSTRNKNKFRFITIFYNLIRKTTLGIVTYLIYRPDIYVPLILGIIILFLLFGSPLFAFLVGVGASIFYLVFGYLIHLLYTSLFSRVGQLRFRRFYLYDAVRALVRPLTPTIPITISLVSVTVFFLVFVNFSIAFRGQLIIDSTNTANIYAINILQSDREKVESIIGSGALMYDILRARVE